MTRKITGRLHKLTEDLLNDPRWADIPSFIKKVDVKTLLPKIRKHNEARQRMLPVMIRISNSLHQDIQPEARDLLKYCNYYGLDTANMDISLSRKNSGNYDITCYRFSPKENGETKTALLIHGYFEHTVLNAPIINRLVDEKYRVLAFDLPGHGFSSGSRFDIDDFHSYGKAVNAFLESLSEDDYPEVMLGHSTGCAAIIDYFGCGGVFPGKIIMAAPLVKSYMYDYSVNSYKVLSKLTQTLPYVFHKHSNDPDFLIFKRFGDMHRPIKVPLHWFHSLIQWNDENISFPVTDKENIHILQGTYDRTVDWKNNIEYLKNMFTNAEVIIFEGAEHNLFNDSAELRHQALEKTISLIRG